MSMKAKPDIHRLIELQQLLLNFSNIDRFARHPDNFDRRETDTEHSYALAMAGWFLAQYFPELNIDTVMRIALVHDLLEVHAGDTFAFANDATKQTKADREADAVKQLAKEWPDFPDMHAAIHEYETRQTAEAKFVYALDKLMPILLNYLNQGKVWRHHGVTFEEFVVEKESKIPLSPEVDTYYRQLLTLLQNHPEFFAPPRHKP